MLKGRIISIENIDRNCENVTASINEDMPKFAQEIQELASDFKKMGIDTSRNEEKDNAVEAIITKYKKETETSIFLDSKSTDKFNKTIFSRKEKAQKYTKYFYDFFDYIALNIKLYASRNKKLAFFILKCSLYVELNERQICIYFGSTAIFSLLPNEQPNKGDSQDGVCLCYQLLFDGSLITILYPAKNHMFSVGEDNIILRYVKKYDLSTLVNYLEQDLNKLFIYQSISDVDIEENFYEKMYYKWLRFRYPIKIKRSDYYSYPQLIKDEFLKNSIVGLIFKVIGSFIAIVVCIFYFIIK